MRANLEAARALEQARLIAKQGAVHGHAEVEDATDDEDGRCEPRQKRVRQETACIPTMSDESEWQPIPVHERCKANMIVETVETPMPDGAAILKVHEPWHTMLLNGVKRWEIRGEHCKKEAGTAGAHSNTRSPTPTIPV